MKDSQVLILIPHYWPGFRWGGPVKSVRNLVAAIGDKIVMKIFTADREFGGEEPYANVIIDQWVKSGKSYIFYASPDKRTVGGVFSFVRKQDFDVLYLNSLFHFRFSIVPYLSWLFFKRKKAAVVIAPRGELTSGALELKRIKKRIFLITTKVLGLYSFAYWHATGVEEKEDIQRIYNVDSRKIFVAKNIPDWHEGVMKQPADSSGALNIVFFSRISEKKNLLYALDILHDVSSHVVFDIYGPIEDQKYWQLCLDRISRLPANIKVNYRGEINPLEVLRIISRYDLMLFPTLGENYGHVVVESLSAGVPVLISDQTPWRGLQEMKAGWDVPLSERERFVRIVSEYSRLDSSERDEWRCGARTFAKSTLTSRDTVDAHLDMFYEVLNASKGRGD